MEHCAAYVGLDWSDRKHNVCLVDAETGRRELSVISHTPEAHGGWEIWAEDLADGGKAVAIFNLSGEDRVLSVTGDQLPMNGSMHNLWRRKDLGPLGDRFSAVVSPHGAAFVKVKP